MHVTSKVGRLYNPVDWFSRVVRVQNSLSLCSSVNVALCFDSEFLDKLSNEWSPVVSPSSLSSSLSSAYESSSSHPTTASSSFFSATSSVTSSHQPSAASVDVDSDISIGDVSSHPVINSLITHMFNGKFVSQVVYHGRHALTCICI